MTGSDETGALSGIWRYAEPVLLTLWVGSLWTIGYLVAPQLFSVLEDRALAGEIAGRLFAVEARLTIVCGLALILGWRLVNGRFLLERRLLLVLLMLACQVSGEWIARPLMVAARAADGAVTSQFALWHGVSAVMYLIASVAGLLLVLSRRPA